MSFSIVLMNNRQELNKISKTPATVLTLNGNLKEETSIVDPQIIIEYNGALTNVNYAYIASFARYYFINDIESIANKLWRVSMHCDVLKTYSEGILGSEAIISNQENNWDPYLNDGQFRARNNPHIITRRFSGGFSGHSYILALCGTSVPAS